MRSVLALLVLLTLKALSRTFYRHDLGWVGQPPPRRWSGYRIVAVLNHTSLFELLWAGSPPVAFLWQIAHHGVVPVADVTAARPLAGRLIGLLARHVVPISRERDHTWIEVMARIDDPRAIVVILPEGRMMRRGGLDKHGKPMTVRGGIADILEAIPEGRMLIAYSGGLHHVQAPGEGFPRLFRTIRMRFECVEIAPYRRQILAAAGEESFRRAVAADLERRRDLHCWPVAAKPPAHAAATTTQSASGRG